MRYWPVRLDRIAEQHDGLPVDPKPPLPAGELGTAGLVEGPPGYPAAHALTPANAGVVTVTCPSDMTSSDRPTFRRILPAAGSSIASSWAARS